MQKTEFKLCVLYKNAFFLVNFYLKIIDDKKLELEGISKDGQEDQYTLYEVHTNLDLDNYEDKYIINIELDALKIIKDNHKSSIS